MLCGVGDRGAEDKTAHTRGDSALSPQHRLVVSFALSVWKLVVYLRPTPELCGAWAI